MRHGFLLIDKPVGPTSHDVVQTVRRALKEPKIGHLGTLDPAASGLLVLAVGNKALKVIEYFQNLAKEYVADIRFGAVSTTYDGEGVIEPVRTKPGWQEPDISLVQRIIQDRFTGNVEQVPPVYSAVHTGGQRAYVLARRGENVTLPSRTVEIRHCSIESYTYPKATLRIECSTGTYIRSLAHDLGDMLRCGAYLQALRRTTVGEWDVEQACSPDTVTWSQVMPLKDVLHSFDGIELNAEEAEDIRHGRKIHRDIKNHMLAWHQGLPIAILVPAKDMEHLAQPRKVL